MKRANYSNTVVYKICAKDNTILDMYIGHTTNFCARKLCHYYCSKDLKNNTRLYKFIRENGGWEKWEMTPIATYKCNNLSEARMKEQIHYEEYQPTLNSIPPYNNKKKCPDMTEPSSKDNEKYVGNTSEKDKMIESYTSKGLNLENSGITPQMLLDLWKPENSGITPEMWLDLWHQHNEICIRWLELEKKTGLKHESILGIDLSKANDLVNKICKNAFFLSIIKF